MSKERQKSYLETRRDLKLKGPKPAAVKRAEQKAKGAFFKDAIAKMPGKCMECGRPLGATIAINAAAVVAHILPKSRVFSMATDKRNMVYLCGDCHTDFDKKGCSHTEKMKLYPLLRERVALMLPEIPQAERRWIPKCLLP